MKNRLLAGFLIAAVLSIGMIGCGIDGTKDAEQNSAQESEAVEEKENIGTFTTQDIYGNEVLSLYGGSDAKLMQFQSAYTVHFEGIKYAVEKKYDKYNFYGITGDFRKENPLYGLYLFKKSFGGHVSELIGEFDYIISPFWYKTYNIAFSTYHSLKNIKKKLTKK